MENPNYKGLTGGLVEQGDLFKFYYARSRSYGSGSLAVDSRVLGTLCVCD